MELVPPTTADLARIAERYHLALEPAELETYRSLMGGALLSYARLDELDGERHSGTAVSRDGGQRPRPEDNPLGAWYWRCSITGATEGRLAGKRLAIKDNVCVAGIPMMNGSSLLEGYVPDIDATVVTRILAEGGEIVGKSVCEHLCFSGGSHTSDTGPVHNPHRAGYSAGGSSSGSAALVAAGEVDMALGGDQGGSIRMPAGWCGVVGHKPTYGLVPYTGAFPIELTLDHLGPITQTCADAALLLDAIAGVDGLDPRQPTVVEPPSCVAGLRADCAGLRVGVLAEGFGWPGVSEPDVDALVTQAAAALSGIGAEVVDVSVPEHRDGIHVWNGIGIEGATSLMVRGDGMGTGWKGLYATSLLDHYARARRSNADALSPTVKLVLLLGQHMQDRHGGRYYAIAQNLSRWLTAAYDAALADVDVLVLPTLPLKATPLPEPGAPIDVVVDRALEMIANTCPFDVTGHPALTVPVGSSDGLPVGMMIVGRRWDDATVLRVGHAYETGMGAAARSPGDPAG